MGMLSAFSPQLLEQAKRSGVLGLPIEQASPDPRANYKRFKGPGLLGALFAGANAAIDSDIYEKGLQQRQNQFLGTISDYDNAIQEAARLGRTDWVDRLKQQQAESSQAALRQQYGGILGGGMPAQQPQPSAIPAPQMAQPAPAPQSDQEPVISKATGLPIQPDVNVVQGTVRRPAPPAPDPNSMAARYEQAAQVAYQSGDIDQAQKFSEAAAGLRKQGDSQREANRQRGAAMLSSALRLSGDAQVQQFNYVLNELADSMGVRFPPEVNDALLDPNMPTEQKAAIVQAMIAYSAPEDVAKAEIEVNKSYNQFRPLERQDLGGSIGVFDPRTGKFRSGPAKTIDPEVFYKENQANRRNSEDNATSRANSIRNANRPIFDDGLFGDSGGQGQPGQVGPWTAYQTQGQNR